MILFLRVLARGSNDYEDFLNKWRQDTNTIVRKFLPYDDEELAQIHSELTKTSPPAPLPPPNQEERGWLYEVFAAGLPSDDLLVLETEAWVKKMKAQENIRLLGLYHQILWQMVDTDRLHTGDTNAQCQIHWGNDQEIGVAYLYRPDLKRLLLLEPVRRSDDIPTLREKHEKLLRERIEATHSLSRIAARSYPSLMVLDRDAWLTIQEDEEANLALSPEEGELVESIHRAGAEGELGYPLFINGRAGSGKSTMLQYLAADYVDFALRQSANCLPLYMTCSRDLLEQARKIVRRLLTAHHSKVLTGTPEPTQVDSVLDRCFQVFHDFLYSLLPSETQQKLPKDRYVNYAEFRRLWTSDFAKRPEARRMSPDVSWHVIRSYIKGIRYNQNDDLEPEEFNSLPRRRRSVSREAYKQVYDRVWLSWYKPLGEGKGYWDDQDLAAHVLDAGVAPKVDRAAIFCDEAQDFTPAELEIIFQLSLFARRSLQPEELRRVPIVFAGDPLQTINPTGFRWDAVRAYFHERFCAVLDPRRGPQAPEMSYRELHFNYRSNPGIVRFCNLIQLVRAALLEGRDIRPQKAWWMDAPVQTVWFPLDNELTTSQLRQYPELVKLVDCHECEETEFVSKDQTLKILDTESEGIYRNVLGPTRAKGLEFSAVVVYRFGESVPNEFTQLLNDDADLEDPEKRLPLEYFFNRLYVAASRAKDQLIVVDSDHTINNFWQFATNPDTLDRLIEKTGKRNLWERAVTTLFRGTKGAWSGEHIDQREQAESYAEKGRRERDPYLMRQAGLAYRSAGDHHEGGRFFALAAEFEGKKREAGKRYRALGLHEEAFRCYWEGQLWQPLSELASQNESLVGRLQSRAADFMANTGTPDVAFLDKLNLAVRDDAWLQKTKAAPTWPEVLVETAKRLAEAPHDKTISRTKLETTLEMLDRSRNVGVPVDDAHLASIAYAAGNFRRAVEFWDRKGETGRSKTDRHKYDQAKANVTPFPERLVFLKRLGNHLQILQQWRDRGLEPSAIEKLDDKIIYMVEDAALDEGDLELVAGLVQTHPDLNRVTDLLAAAVKADNDRVVSTAAVLAARLYVQTCDWTAAVAAADNARFSGLAEITAKKVRSSLDRMGSREAVLKAVVRELAKSEALTQNNSKPIEEFLKRRFIGRGAKGGVRGIPPEVVGAAIERAGKIVDALQYYENLSEDASTTQNIKRFAVERLVCNLERHAEHYRNENNNHRAQEQESRAKQLREEADTGDRELDKYPDVDGMEFSELPENANEVTENQRNPFEIVPSARHGRVRIEHKDRFETVTVDARNRRLRGDANFSKVESLEEGSIAWEIRGWNATVELITNKENFRVRINFDGGSSEVLLTEERG